MSVAMVAPKPTHPRERAPGERELIRTRPSAWSIVLRRAGLVVFFLVVAAGAGWFGAMLSLDLGLVVPIAVVLALCVWLWNALELLSRDYVLTDRRVARTTGVVRRLTTEIHLKDLEHVLVYRSLRERVFGLGTIGFASAGTGAVEVAWVMVARPDERLKRVREAMDAWRSA